MNSDLNTNCSVYCCYLLRCWNPKWKNHFYIGFTNNPPHRIRQHNGEIDAGAKKTLSKRPWEMVLFVYGFPTKNSALKFEWHLQHPKKSRLVKNYLKQRSYKRGIHGRIKILFEMLSLAPWKNYLLNINFTTDAHYDTYFIKNTIKLKTNKTQKNNDRINQSLKYPPHMKIYVRELTQLNFFNNQKQNKPPKFCAFL